MEQKEFSVRETAASFISAAKEHETLVFKKDPNEKASYNNIKTNLQSLNSLQQSQVMGYVRDSAIRVNGQEPDHLLNGYGTLRSVYSEVLTDMLDDKCYTVLYATRNGNQETASTLRNEMTQTLKSLPNDQLADLNGSIASLHEAKDISYLATLPQVITTKAFEEAGKMVSAEMTFRQEQTMNATEATPEA